MCTRHPQAAVIYGAKTTDTHSLQNLKFVELAKGPGYTGGRAAEASMKAWLARPALRVASSALSARNTPPTLSLASLLPAAIGEALPPLALDAASSLGLAVLATAWVKFITTLAATGQLQTNLSRKLIHTTSAPVFLLCWPLFSELPEARLLASIVPSLQIAKLWLASRGKLGADGEQMVRAISRSESTNELAGGPLVYTLVLLVAGLLGWRTLWAAVAICQMAVGDGLADIVGRRFGTVKWPFAPTKSPAGSAAFVLGAFASSLGMVAYFHLFGYTPIGGASPAPQPRSPAAVASAPSSARLRRRARGAAPAARYLDHLRRGTRRRTPISAHHPSLMLLHEPEPGTPSGGTYGESRGR